MCRLFETLARQFGEPTLQYLQGEYRSVAQLGEQELFGFLCMLERGCGYVAKGLSYDAAFREVVKPLLELRPNHMLANDVRVSAAAKPEAERYGKAEKLDR